MPKIKSAPKAMKPIEDDNRVYVCSCCGKEFSGKRAINNFPYVQSELYKGNKHRLNVCRNCIDKLFLHYAEVLGNDDDAIRRICMKFDMYFSTDITKSKKCRNVNADNSKIGTYISILNMQQYKDKTFDTTLDEEANSAIESISDLKTYNKAAEAKNEDPDEEEVATVVSMDDIANWGTGFEPDEYAWLNAKYDKIRSTNIIDTTTREELVRDHCVQRLMANKARQNNDMKNYDSLTDSAQKTLDRANLTPKITDAADKAGEKPIGVMIQMFEKERPIPEARPEWRDVDGILKFVTVYFIGHLCKMLGLKNRYVKLYEDEMDKYRADIPEYNDMDDEDIFSMLIGSSNDGSDGSRGDKNDDTAS